MYNVVYMSHDGLPSDLPSLFRLLRETSPIHGCLSVNWRSRCGNYYSHRVTQSSSHSVPRASVNSTCLGQSQWLTTGLQVKQCWHTLKLFIRLLPPHLFMRSKFLISCLHIASFCVSSPDSPFSLKSTFTLFIHPRFGIPFLLFQSTSISITNFPTYILHTFLWNVPL